MAYNDVLEVSIYSVQYCSGKPKFLIKTDDKKMNLILNCIPNINFDFSSFLEKVEKVRNVGSGRA